MASTAVLAACSAPIEVETQENDRATATACTEFLAALPDELDGRTRREVEPAGAPAIAWGDPPVVVTCGVNVPEELTKFSRCQVVDGVGWFAPKAASEDPTIDVTLTTIGVQPVVSVKVPAELRPPDAALVTVSEAIRGTLGVDEPCA